MQLKLKPVSNAQLGEIIVSDGGFVIGRNEDHFESYEASVTAKLSRRHARIYERDGRMYITDLNSSNGTTVNGLVVEGDPIQLQLDDEVQFGGLCYRVEFPGGGEETRLASDLPAEDAKLILTPAAADSPLEPIVVSKFPFPVSRYSDVFARYQDAYPKQLSLISKNHARLTLKENAIFVEDLGSTNGTRVCGNKLTSEPRRLENDDTLAFADEIFTYHVQVFVGEQTMIEANAQIEKLSDGTIFVDDATNFFEIYMAADNKDASVERGAADSETDQSSETRVHAPKKRVGKMRRFFHELRGSLRAGEPVDRSLRWTVVASLAALIVTIAGYWYLAWPAQQIEKQMDDGLYQSAAELADQYLGRRPDNDQLEELGTAASMKAYVPMWQAAIDAGDYEVADEVLAQARQTGMNISRDDVLIDALELAGTVSRLDLSRDRQITLNDILSGDETISTLVEQWDAMQTENRRALLQIGQMVDGFDAYQTDFYRSLRTLRENARVSQPLHELRANINAALADRDTIRLRQSIADYSAQYPDTDLTPLAEDVVRYEAIELDISENEWLRAHDRANRTEFNTPPFSVHLVFMNRAVLPDAATLDAYARAGTLWAEGNAIDSFTVYEELAEKRWGEDAQRLLERDRSLLTAVVELLDNPAAPDFEDRLFTLFGQLDATRDAFLHATLQADFDRHREAALALATDRTGQAQEAWADYDQSGRLQGAHRLEERVSSEYRRLAGLLTEAYQYLRESELIYEQLETPSPRGWVDIHRDVIQEIKFQTGIVANLLVIDADVRKAKVDLLPELPPD